MQTSTDKQTSKHTNSYRQGKGAAQQQPNMAAMMQAVGPMLAGMGSKAGKGATQQQPDMAATMQAVGPMLAGMGSQAGKGTTPG